MKALEGRHIGCAADRKAAEISQLIQKHGGIPVIKPIQGTRWLDEKSAENDVAHFLAHDYDWMLLTTGIGAEALEKAAERLGRLDEYIHKLSDIHLAIRGSKTLKWLKKWQLIPEKVSPDGTMLSLIHELEGAQQRPSLFYQSYDQEEAALIERLKTLHIAFYHSAPYHYLPPDQTILEELRFCVTSQAVDAVLFTSKTQVENLFHKTSESQHKLLVKGFNQNVLAVAVGSVTARALADQGITNVLEPKRPKMGAMVIALTEYY
ncbi:hypothetical protein GCM10011391_04960 [Pullulanibacillus camelliae]|uniref:Tetrapyrrole biosynthesis uroporphyrinogen III synthase domain-containing protein n=1 Tax=Pullulanibacillus camelliae TaxID=1707096 RepID=A0A8J2YFL0_9BACL|nr:uroporphyrinogen-III synthase [Pullulanibacillus camelliae]GGE29415.1 hypothetical protein GCM10011391_04960 [Pullulanibacillus camelliae]